MFDKALVGRLYQEAGMFKPENLGILNHMTGVAHIAGFWARQLVRHGVTIDIDLVENGAMLHDIGKVLDENAAEHAIKGARFLREQMVDEEIVRIVERHEVYTFKRGKIPDPSTWEEKLVFLADLFFSDHIVAMRERREDIISRYPVRRKVWLRKESEMLYREILEIISPQTFPF